MLVIKRLKRGWGRGASVRASGEYTRGRARLERRGGGRRRPCGALSGWNPPSRVDIRRSFASCSPVPHTHDNTRTGPRSVLFTAFEPSGDEHAAVVIRELRRRDPSLVIHAWGGERMERAGAVVVERTGLAATMGMPGLAKILEHRRINRRVESWVKSNRPCLHVAVDSPAANFPICKITRAHGASVVHLVAPQMWAWGSWRVRKLRRLTDHVLCLLPFEPDWFEARGVRATFVGHPLLDHELDEEAIEAAVHGFPEGSPKVAIMPGSRPSEITANFPMMLETFRRIRERQPGAACVVAATTERVRERLREIANEWGGWPEGMDVVVAGVDSATRWCDLAIVVSGTVTLHVARQHKPMVVIYRVNKFTYALVGRWIIAADHIALPNLVAGRRIVPEIAPKTNDDPAPIVEQAMRLLDDADARRAMRDDLADTMRRFEGRSAATGAADAIEQTLRELRPALVGAT
ncbi:MAG: lipid-A-disaccharide synthase [Phycisphaerales bacterium]|nr:MAG: lipid-A-disaccharide synthase [Phycisphaerales bacterium]